MESHRRGCETLPSKVEYFISAFPINFWNAHCKYPRGLFEIDRIRLTRIRDERAGEEVWKKLKYERWRNKVSTKSDNTTLADFTPLVRFLPSAPSLRIWDRWLSSFLNIHQLYVLPINDFHFIIPSCAINSFTHFNFTIISRFRSSIPIKCPRVIKEYERNFVWSYDFDVVESNSRDFPRCHAGSRQTSTVT